MKPEMIQLIGAVIVLISEAYVTEPWKVYQSYAKFWDFIARLCGELANALGHISMRARASYYTAVSYGN